ncbi:fatty acid desaturase family protein [Microlunatus flavus]|uniref:Fatty acid desaturase n=1 Tax=Microlunatus flavus TaxID=1036181 RepID=A0A1H9IDN1_9ACTN|nr:acyl-CoA desaturase [Microlunatus flavus]SEQ72648.1 Fatty acid desaturase [Microlunatus flavus]
MSLTLPSPTRPRRSAAATTQTYTALAQASRTLGLQDRTRWFYALVLAALVLALAGATTGLVLLDDSWLQLLVAGALGVVFTQLAFLGHEASHRQVLASGPANDRAGWWLAVVGVGISYSWWMDKHTRHHGNPNKLGKDPDLAIDTFSFVEEDAATRRGPMAWFTRHQGVFFFPLLLGEGVNLHVRSTQSLWTNRHLPGRKLELVALAARFAVYLTLLFWLLPLGLGFAFLGVQLAVFGFYMGASFAPNHIGMAVVPRDVKLDFLSKQVATSRNVSGGWWATVLMGGLNYQIEHHLFPSMPRPHLAAARRLVREHCRANDVAYTETNLLSAWAIVARHLNQVGLAAPDAFRCPMVAQLR